MPASTLILLVSIDADPRDVDVDEAARGAVDAEEKLRRALERRGLRVGGLSSTFVALPMDRVGAALGAFADSLEKPRE